MNVAETVAATDSNLHRLLEETILPFWYPILSAKTGAFTLNHDVSGVGLGPRRVSIVAQSRILWTCARLVECGIRPDFFAPAGARTLRFLLDRMWDREHGGFHWGVAADGSVSVADKHLYGQAFALLGLARYARVAADDEAADAARRLFEFMERWAHDRDHGGYREWFSADWSQPPPGRAGPLGMPVGVKTQNVHLHLMDALRELVETTADATARFRLVELILINATTVQRKSSGSATDAHRTDWRPLKSSAGFVGSYGHMLELAWMVPRAAVTAGLPRALVEDLATTMATTVLRFGFDRAQGGVYHSGPVGHPADRMGKTWWTQAEALAAFLERWQATGKELWAVAYLKTLTWIEDRQVDRVHGEWHSTVEPDGTATGLKADQWKCPYHHVRAILHCRDLLRRPITRDTGLFEN